MASFDQKNNLSIANAFDIQTISSDTTTAGDIIDMQGFEALTFVFQTGTVTDGDYTVLIEEGDAANLSDAAAVADSDLIGTEADASFTADTDDNAVSSIGYRGGKRYVRLSIVSTNTSSGAVVGAIAVKGKPATAKV